MSANEAAVGSLATEICPHCRTQVDSQATICIGCGARKLLRGFPNGSTGFATFCLLWLVPAGFFIITPLSDYAKQHSTYQATPGLSGGTAFALVCVGVVLFFGGLKWIRKLMARAQDVVWVR